MMNLANTKIGWRLGVAFGLIGVLTVGIFLAASWGDYVLSQGTEDLLQQTTMRASARNVGMDVKDIFLAIHSLASVRDLEVRQRQKTKLEKIREGYRQRMEVLGKAEAEKGKQLLDNIANALTNGKALNNQVLSLSEAGKYVEALALLTQGEEAKRGAVEAEIGKYLEYRQQRVQEADAAAKATAKKVHLLMVLLVIGVLSLSAFLSVAISRSVVRPLRAGIGVVERISKEDVSSDVPEELRARKDEVGELASAMQTMTGNLRQLMGGISAGVQRLAASLRSSRPSRSKRFPGLPPCPRRLNAVAAAAEEASASTMSIARAWINPPPASPPWPAPPKR